MKKIERTEGKKWKRNKLKEMKKIDKEAEKDMLIGH